MEDPIPSIIEIKSQVTIRLEKPHGVPKKIYDRQRNKRDDNKVPKWEIGARKLDP